MISVRDGEADPALVDLAPVARRVVEAFGAAPAAVASAILLRASGATLGLGAAGKLSFDPEAPAAREDTPFDLASVTKSIVALTLARMQRAGVIRRAELLGDVLPAAAGTASARVPLDLLLAHRGGLDAHRTLFAPLLDGRAVDRALALHEAADARRHDCLGDPPRDGFPPVYSDLGYLLVGEAIAARAGEALDAVIAREVTGPLGLSIRSARQWEAVEPARFSRVAPTEVVPFRGGLVSGRVHDENAFAIALDACAGHAGLFGDAESVARLGGAILQALAGDSAWLSAEDVSPLLRRRPGGSHRAGFDGKSGDAPSAGARFGPETFGHLGFTGTSLWIDPEARLAAVLLTNRVHPTRDHVAIRAARPAAYDAMFDAMTSSASAE